MRARVKPFFNDQMNQSYNDTILDEPFPCPTCGQMLAPSVRVCVVCKQPIDPAQIQRRPPESPAVEVHPPGPGPRARFSWRIFFLVLVAWLSAAAICQHFLGYAKSQIALGGVVVLTSIWVFFDAGHKAVPKPLRWWIGSLLLWIIFFPWYLARRRTPEARCPFESEVGPVVRALLFILIAFFLLSAVLVILKGPTPR